MLTLDSEQINILKYLDKNIYIDRAIAFQNFSISADYSINTLLQEGYISMPKNDSQTLEPFAQLDIYVLTGKGYAYLRTMKEINEVQKRRLRIEAIKYWVPICISSILSIIAIIISILK